MVSEPARTRGRAHEPLEGAGPGGEVGLSVPFLRDEPQVARPRVARAQLACPLDRVRDRTRGAGHDPGLPVADPGAVGRDVAQHRHRAQRERLQQAE